jgi:hypothetical protein
MRSFFAIALAVSACSVSLIAAPEATQMARPRAGKVETLPVSAIKPGQKAVAWTVFTGSEPEAVPVEIIGVWKNAWGPKQDIIVGKMGGKADRTSVAKGMSGSPVYIDGKLIGAVSTQIGQFSPDAICGITPIDLMLEIKDFDASRPSDALTPERVATPRASVEVPHDILAAVNQTGLPLSPNSLMRPIDSPLMFSGFHPETLRQFGGMFEKLGVQAVQGGASGAIQNAKLAKDWQNSLQPGDSIAGVLVSGDLNITGLGTVTYNDGKKVLGFGHQFFNLGPVDMPMSKGEVLMVLASTYQPMKIANATEIVGALKQDRHSGILGELGATSPMIPVSVKVRSLAGNGSVRNEKELKFNVFVQQKWTPFLMMLTLFNSVSGMNDFAEDTTYRLNGTVELEGDAKLSLNTMFAPSEMPVPAPIMLAGWWGDKFNRLFGNAVKTPSLKSVNVSVDLLPERRMAALESAYVASTEVEAGTEVPVKVYLRPYRGERMEKEIKVKIPSGMPKGDHRILLSDADTLNRMQTMVANSNRFLDLPETVSLINQERSNNRLYVSLIQGRPTFFDEDKTMPALPASVWNVMQSGRSGNRPLVSSPETAQEQLSLPFDHVVTGSQSLKITVR